MSKEQEEQQHKLSEVGRKLLESATKAVDPDEVNKSCIRGPRD